MGEAGDDRQSSDSDWESYQEDGDEGDSQIEALETILQQEDEGGLDNTHPRRPDRLLLADEADDDMQEELDIDFPTDDDEESEDDVNDFDLREIGKFCLYFEIFYVQLY